MSALKWVGGKSELLPDILSKIPKRHYNSYYELFLGGGSVLIQLLEEQESILIFDSTVDVLEMLENLTLNETANTTIKIDHFNANDINKALIAVYREIKDNHIELMHELDILQTSLNESKEIPTEKNKVINIPDNWTIENAKQSRKHFYYFIRKRYNDLMAVNKLVSIDNISTIDRITMAKYFIFLNKTCFRGLYRESGNGNNVPYGNYKNPKLYNHTVINRQNYLFNKYNVNFTNKSYDELTQLLSEENCLVYLDPPYAAINSTSFVAYSNAGFSDEDLITFLDTLHSANIQFLMSNSYVKWIIDICAKYNQAKISCRRRINSKNPESSCDEILVWNSKN